MTAIATPAFLTPADFTDVARQLTFESEPHIYRIAGEAMPSVTGILKAAGVSTNFEELVATGQLTQGLLDEAKAIGTAVHQATHYYDEGSLHLAEYLQREPRAEEGLQNWIDWRELTGFVPVLLETALWHPEKRFAGTTDRAGYFTKFEHWKRCDLAIVDLKWGDPKGAGTWWQTAAYAEMLSLSLAPTSPWHPGPAGFYLRPRYAVHLQGARAALHRYDDMLRDWNQFKAFEVTYRCQVKQRKATGRG